MILLYIQNVHKINFKYKLAVLPPFSGSLSTCADNVRHEAFLCRNNSSKYANCLGKMENDLGAVESCKCKCVCVCLYMCVCVWYMHISISVSLSLCAAQALNECVFMWLTSRMRNMIIIRPVCPLLNMPHIFTYLLCSFTSSSSALSIFYTICIIDKIFAGIFLMAFSSFAVEQMR